MKEISPILQYQSISSEELLKLREKEQINRQALPAKSIRARSTYTLNNALKFKKIFDDAINSGQNITIDYPPNSSRTAFHAKINDALRWLIANYDDEVKDKEGNIIHKLGSYQDLRRLITFRAEINCIHLAFLMNEISSNYRTIDTEANKGKAWRDKLDIYLQDPSKKGIPLTMKGLYLSNDDIQLINHMLGQLGEDKVEFEVNENEIKVLKI